MDDAAYIASWARVALVLVSVLVLFLVVTIIEKRWPEPDDDPGDYCDGCPFAEAHGCSAACL